MQTIDFKQVTIRDGFVKFLQERNERVSIYNVYRRFEETGRFRAMKCVRDDEHRSHIFWDSDVAKWLESAAFILAKTQDAKLKELADAAIADICASQREDGYFNCYFQVYEPENIFKKRTEHELYCAGHLIEAAVALHESGVDEKLLAAMRRYADYIYDRFYVKKDTAFVTCGHPEIELALVKLYQTTGEKKYLDLADFFIEERGKHSAKQNAVDHPHKKMYITGGVGSSYHGEAFTFAYDLPNNTAYSETCAAIALALFCDRLAKIENRAEYHAVFERAFYNNILAGESKDGKGFFYVNPLEMHEAGYDYNEWLRTKLFYPIPERVEVFDCSCCPPNLTRTIESIGSYIYGTEGDQVYVNQYISSETSIGGAKICIDSEMPFGGRATVCVEGQANLNLRVPAWNGGVRMKVNGRTQQPCIADGYIRIACDGDIEIALDFVIKPRFVYANENVWQDCGRKAVEYGPLVLCAESADNGKNLRDVRIRTLAGAKAANGEYFTLDVKAERLHTSEALYSYEAPKTEECTLRLIPYFQWANRGKGDMQIWFL